GIAHQGHFQPGIARLARRAAREVGVVGSRLPQGTPILVTGEDGLEPAARQLQRLKLLRRGWRCHRLLLTPPRQSSLANLSTMPILGPNPCRSLGYHPGVIPGRSPHDPCTIPARSLHDPWPLPIRTNARAYAWPIPAARDNPAWDRLARAAPPS